MNSYCNNYSLNQYLKIYIKFKKNQKLKKYTREIYNAQHSAVAFSFTII